MNKFNFIFYLANSKQKLKKKNEITPKVLKNKNLISIYIID